MSEIEDRIVVALAKAFKADTSANPEWDRRADMAAWREGDEYLVPEFVPATIEQMRERSPMIVFTAGDGGRSIRSATLVEIADIMLDAFPALWEATD